MKLNLLAFLLVFFSINAFAKSEQIGKCEASDSYEECISKFEKTIYLSKKFSESYSPEMGRMLAVTAYSVRLMEEVKELSSSEPLKQKFYEAMITHSHNLALHGASIKYEEMEDYANNILVKVLDEAVDLAAEGISNIPVAKLTPAGVAVRALPGFYDVSKDIINGFPKQEIISAQSARDTEEQRAIAFQLYSEFVFSDEFQNLSQESSNLVDTTFASTIGVTSNIDEAKLGLDSDVVQFRAIQNLVEKNGEILSLKIDESNAFLAKQIEDSGLMTVNAVKEVHQDLSKKADILIEGQANLTAGQFYLIEGVDFLTQSELEAQELHRINKLPYEKLVEEISQEITCSVPSETNESGIVVYSPRNLREQTCAAQFKVRKVAEEKEDDMHDALIMNNINKSVEVLGQIASLTKDKNLQKIVSDAGKLIKAFEEAQKAIDAIKSIEDASNIAVGMSSFLTGVGAITAVIKIFGSSGPSADELILKQLAAISKSIAELHKDMEEKFEGLRIKIDELSKDVKNALLLQNVFISQNQLSLFENQDKNTKVILDYLIQFGLVKSDNKQYFYRSALTDLSKEVINYSSNTDPNAIKSNFQDMLSSYASLLKGMIIKNPDYVSFELNDFDSLSRNTDLLFQSLAVLKSTSYGKNALLSSLINLNQGSSAECKGEVLDNAVFANILSDEFSKGLSFQIDPMFNAENNLNYVLQRNPSEIRSSISTIEMSLEILYSLQNNLEKCFGLYQNEEKVIQNLFQVYHTQMKENVLSISNINKEKLKMYQDQILIEIKQGADLKIGSESVFNGLRGENRLELKDKVAFEFSNLNQLEDSKKASQLFMSRDYPNIGICFSQSNSNVNRKPLNLEFPKATLDKLITDNHLKVALASGLIKWDFCVEIGEYDSAKMTKDIFLVAKQQNESADGGNEDKIMALWPLKINIPAELTERASFDWKQTTRDECITLFIQSKKKNISVDFPSEYLIPKKCSEIKEKITLVDQCIAKPKREDKAHQISRYVNQLTYQGWKRRDRWWERLNYLSTKAIMSFAYTECEHLDDVVSEVWSAQTVQSHQAWDSTKAVLPNCSFGSDGMIKSCFATAKKENRPPVTEEEIKKDLAAKERELADIAEKAVKIAESSNYSWADLNKAHEEVRDWGQAGTASSIKRGVALYYLKLKKAHSSCHFAMLKGLSCAPVNGNVIFPSSKMNMSNLLNVFELILQTPRSFYTIKPEIENQIEIEKQLLTYFSNFKSPNQIIELAENIYNSGELDAGIDDLIGDLLQIQEDLFNKKIMPIIKENYEIDRSLLLEPNAIDDLEKLKVKLELAI